MIERNLPVTAASIIEVICTVSHRGEGTNTEPVRIIYQYWSKTGTLLAEHDTIFDDDTNTRAL
jgi:hypothetical protein